MTNSPRQSDPPLPLSPTRAHLYHSAPLPESPSHDTFAHAANDIHANDNTIQTHANPRHPTASTTNTPNPQRTSLPPLPASPTTTSTTPGHRSSTGSMPASPGGPLHRHPLSNLTGTPTTTTTTTAAETAGGRSATPVQFNTSEIQRSFQALLKKQPMATPGPALLQSKNNRLAAPKDSGPSRQPLPPKAHSHLGAPHPQDKSPSSIGRHRHYNALSHSPVFGSPASEHARNWIKSVGRDLLSDSESEQRESDHDSYEDSQQQQWQIDYDHDVAGQVELESEADVKPTAPWANKVHLVLNANDPQASKGSLKEPVPPPGYASPKGHPRIRIKDQRAIHPLSPAPTSPNSGTSTPRMPQSRSPEIRPQAVLFPAAAELSHAFDIGSIPPLTSSAVNQPLPPLPAPPTASPDKPRPRTKYNRHLELLKKPSKRSLLATKPISVTERQPVSLSNPPRKCIHHGKILQVINTSTVKDRYLFLFSDLLLIAKHMSEGHPTLDSRFQVKDVIELKKISLSLTRDKYDPKTGESGGAGNRKIPPILAEFIHTFDQNPTRALNTFIQKRALHPDPVSVAHLLFKTPELSKTQLALFFSNPANKHVYRAFLDQCQFAGVLLDEALRTLLSRLSLPDRAHSQRSSSGSSSERTINGVDYLLEEFTKRWYDANVNVVVFDASIAHKLVIAMIVLNAQLHNNEGASIVKEREEVGMLVRPRVNSQPSTPTIASTPVMESNLTVPPTPTTQQYMTMDLDDLTAFPTPSKESFVEMFQLLDQQRIVPRDTLNNIFMSITHQPLDIDSDKLDTNTHHTDSTPAVARKLWTVMMSPAVLPPRLTLKIPSDPMTITIPALNPHFSIHLGGRDLKCEPSVLEFGSHRSQRFRITGSVPGKKTLTIQPKLLSDKGGTAEQYYDLQNLPLKHTIAIERQFMRHTFQISLLNDLGTRRRYLFGASTAAEKDEWARVLSDCLLLAKGQNAVRLNEHTGLEQSIGLQILKELLLGVEASDEDEVPPPTNGHGHGHGQAEAVPLPMGVVSPPAMGLGIPLEGHGLQVTSPRSVVNPMSAALNAVGAGHPSPTLGTGAASDWAIGGVHTTGVSGPPRDAWMCRMPKPGSAVPDRHGWELVRLVEQNSLMALMLGFMGALGRDRLRRMEEMRRRMQEEEEEEEEEEQEEEDEEGRGEEEDEEEEANYEYDDQEEEEFEEVYHIQHRVGDHSQTKDDSESERPLSGVVPQTIEILVEHVSLEGDDSSTALPLVGDGEDGAAAAGSESEEGVVSTISGRVRKVKGKEIWWTQ
ncbi:hypothetical protein EDD11_007322 [Mortierella claussenii]|nr:hypothetical protein EDD11_007322 [Mortierella claussenii]